MQSRNSFILCLVLLHGLVVYSSPLLAAVDLDARRITIALTEEPPQLNSMKATDQVSIFMLGHVMEGLVRYDRRGNIVPGVAKSWQMDGTTATFVLRQDARWSDGKPVTAHDFVFAWRNALDPATASEYAFILYPIMNGEAINNGDLPLDQLGVTAKDDTTLVIQLQRAIPYFLKLGAFASYFPVREDFFNSKGERYAADAGDLIYNGPFRLTEWVHSASLKMEKNDQYWDRDNIFLNEIHAEYITQDTRARLNLFSDNKIVYTALDGETYKDALNKKFRIRAFTTGSVFFLEYNHRPERTTSNVNLRRAIQYVYDADEMVNKVLATPGNIPGHSLIPVWVSGVDRKFREEYPAEKIKPDLDKAQEYLELARQQLGVERIPPLVLLVSDSPTSTKQAEYLQGLLKNRLGLDVKIDKQIFKQRLAKMTSGDFDIVGAGWGPDFDDIMTFGDLFASWNLNNRGRYSNPRYDESVRIAMNSTVPKVRMDAMSVIQNIVHEQAVILPQYEQGVIYLLHPKLRGVVRRVIGTDPDFTRARITR
jgi:oligopeptide transport system substrate-binding protein